MASNVGGVLGFRVSGDLACIILKILEIMFLVVLIKAYRWIQEQEK